MPEITLLDGPLGTELQRRGVDTSGPAWSATALQTAPEIVAAIHADYAGAGATVHTSNTFRTQRWTVGDRWTTLTRLAVKLARDSVPADHRVAGSIAPLEDCYRPDLSPGSASHEHRLMAEHLAECGADVILVETFAHVEEALGAVRAGVLTGLPTWCSLTAGWQADLMTVQELAEGARRAVDLGATAVLVNCVPASATAAYVAALAKLAVPFGAYANAGHPDEGIGWIRNEQAPAAYAGHARQWVAAGATLVGTCCGTGPEHVRFLANNVVYRTTRQESDQ